QVGHMVGITANVIGGEQREGVEGRLRENVAPATGELLSRVVMSSAEDVDDAVADAQEGAARWAALEPGERRSRLLAWAAALRAEAQQIALTDATDSGTPVRTMLAGVTKGADYVDYFAGLEATGETIPATRDHLHLTILQPFGVVGLILPFNHPAFFAISKTAPSLAAGNSAVVRPAEQPPMSTVRIAELAAQTLGPGVYVVVQGDAEAGQALVRHPVVRRLHFTGSVATGLAIQAGAAASGQVKRVTLELGGKNPLIVFPDADPDVAAQAAVDGMNFTRNQGQSCGSTSRLFVHRSLYERITDAVVARLEAIELGRPEDPATQMGCLVSPAQQASVLEHIRVGVEQGARLRTGGRPAEGQLASGAYVLPTLFDEVSPDMALATEEIFGPVLSVIPWDTEE